MKQRSKTSRRRPISWNKKFLIKDLMVEVLTWKAVPKGPCACDTYCTECSGAASCGHCSDDPCTIGCSGLCSDNPCSRPTYGTREHASAKEAVSDYKRLEKKLAAALAEVKMKKATWQAKAKIKTQRR